MNEPCGQRRRGEDDCDSPAAVEITFREPSVFSGSRTFRFKTCKVCADVIINLDGGPHPLYVSHRAIARNHS